MNMFALVQRKIKTDESYDRVNKITTIRVRPDMYFNFTSYKNDADQKGIPKTTRDFERALSNAFQAFDDVMKKEMESE